MKFKLIVSGLLILSMGAILITRNNAPPTVKKTAGNFADLIGKPAPDFTLQDYSGKTISLNQLRGKKVVLFFNEGVMCYPACWNQVAALGTDNKLNNDQVTSASIVPDGAAEWIEATKRLPDLAKGLILLDPGNDVSTKYGTLFLDSSMHKGGKPGHTYVVIDKDGIVRYTYDDPKMGIQNNRVGEALAKI